MSKVLPELILTLIFFRPIRETDEADVSPVDTVVEDDSVEDAVAADEEARKMKKKVQFKL